DLSVRVCPVCFSLMVTTALGTAPPLESTTVPTIEPYNTCACAGPADIVKLRKAAARLQSRKTLDVPTYVPLPIVKSLTRGTIYSRLQPKSQTISDIGTSGSL